MEFLRLFTAVRPPPDAITAIMATQVLLRSQIEPRLVGWIGQEKMHITIHFLGDTLSDRVQEVKLALALGLSRSEVSSQINLTAHAVGAFPNAKRPRVIWVGIQDPSGGLARVHQEVAEQLRERGLLAEDRPFRPHISLGYVRRRATGSGLKEIAAAIARAHQVPDGARNTSESPMLPTRFNATALSLIRSRPSQSGVVYDEIHCADISPASDRASSGESARE